MLPLIFLIPVAIGGGYVAWRKGLFGHVPGGPAAPVSSVNASAAIQKQINDLHAALTAQQAMLSVAQATSNGPGIANATAAIQGINIQLQQLQSQLAHAATL